MGLTTRGSLESARAGGVRAESWQEGLVRVVVEADLDVRVLWAVLTTRGAQREERQVRSDGTLGRGRCPVAW